MTVGLESYCECPEETDWQPYSCDPCLVIDANSHDIELAVVEFTGDFLVGGEPAPASEYDDANLWLENSRTGDRVLVGNTHDLSFAVRVTPGIYELVYEVETPGAQLPRNPRVQLSTMALFDSRAGNIDIPVARVWGPITLDGAAPPADEYDDANVLLRDVQTGAEVIAGNTHDGEVEVAVVPGSYDLVYRSETPGQVAPINDGAVLETLTIFAGDNQHDVEITSVSMQGEFLLDGVAAPVSEYEDANVMLESLAGGAVALGNTHDGAYQVNVIPGDYAVVYMHESGASVPQNQRATIMNVLANGSGPVAIDVPMVQLSGDLTVNGALPPSSEFDDGLVYLGGHGNDDIVALGNTHDGPYQVNVIPGEYDVYYSQETAGGTVPENKRARVRDQVVVDGNMAVDVDIEAISISGSLTLGGQVPPTSVYEDGRLYLRNAQTDDALLLGSTSGGSYSAVVMPGQYEVFYAQEAGGDVPSNQNASLGPVAIAEPMTLDLDVPVVDLGGPGPGRRCARTKLGGRWRPAGLAHPRR